MCWKCGAENRISRLFCASCGSYLREENARQGKTQATEGTEQAHPEQRNLSGTDPIPDTTGQRSAGQPGPRATAGPPTYRGNQRKLGVLLLILLVVSLGILGTLSYRVLTETPPSTPSSPPRTATTTAVVPGTVTGDSTSTATSETASASPVALEPVVPVLVAASSVLPAEGENTYEPENLIDNDLLTAWNEGADGPGNGEWVQFNFAGTVRVARVDIANGYQKDSRRFEGNGRVRTLRLTYSDGEEQVVQLHDDLGYQQIVTPATDISWVRITILSAYPGDTWDDTAISEVHFFGEE